MPPPYGGIASWTLNLNDYITKRQNDITIEICNSAIKGRSITSTSFVKRIGSGINNSIKIYIDAKRKINKTKPDVVHLVSSASLALIKDFFIVSLTARKKIPIVLHWHFGRIPELCIKQNWEWKLIGKLIRKSTLSLVIDKSSYDTLINSGFTNVVNIPNPISLDLEKKAMASINLLETKKPARLIFVGHVVRAKGVYELVEACLLIPEVSELIIIGPFEEDIKKDLLAIANRRNNGKWLQMTGALNREQVLEEMGKASILVLPSYTEGFPNVVIEAMAMGCAIIATDVGAIPEMIDNKNESPCGVCVPAQDTKALKDAIKDLMDNSSKTSLMGKNGIQKVLNSYTMDKIYLMYNQAWTHAYNN